MSVWVSSCVYWCAVCNGDKVASLISFTAASLYPLGLPHLTMSPGPGVPGATGLSTLLHSLHCYVYLRIFVELVTSLVRRVRCTMRFIIPIHKLWLSAVSYYPFFVRTSLQFISRPPPRYIRQRCRGGYGRSLLQSPSIRARLIKVVCVITNIIRHRFSNVWHDHSVAIHSNMRRNVFDDCHRCESNGIGHRVAM